MEALSKLRSILATVPGRLRALSDEGVRQPSAPGKWSPKQELGHLIDSACNNHQRIVRSQVEESPAMPDYDGDRWVELHGYQHMEWDEIIERWCVLNRQLLTSAAAIPPEAWQRTLTVGGGQRITVEFLVADYVDHMVHHLRHIGIGVAEGASAA